MELLVFKVKRRSQEYHRMLEDLPQHGALEVWELPTYGEFTLDDDQCLTTATKAITWKGRTQGEVQRLADLPVLTPRDETRLWVKMCYVQGPFAQIALKSSARKESLWENWGST